MWDTSGPIGRGAFAAARRLLADPALFERAVVNIRQTPDYDGWSIDEYTVLPALAGAAHGAGQAHDVAALAADARLQTEFLCRITASGSIDYYEGDDPDPSDFDLGPQELFGEDVRRALQTACDLAERYRWVR